MPNVTLSLQEDIFKAGRDYAKRHHTSLNALIRGLLTKTVFKQGRHSRLEECFAALDREKPSSGGKKWRREDLYRV